MADKKYPYVIIGGGPAGTSAVEGIREIDRTNDILMITAEKHLPYDRPPLSKKLWSGRKKIENIFLRDQAYYDANGVSLALGTMVASIDVKQKAVKTAGGASYGFDKLLLATGGAPRRLSIPGGDLEGITYFRTLDDYLKMRKQSDEGGKTALVVGGGFIGSELSAAMHTRSVAVTMIFPDAYLASRVFPASLGSAIQERYRARGITILNNDAPVDFEKKGMRFATRTRSGSTIETDMIVVGIGIAPSLDLAGRAGLQTADGIIVDEHLRTSMPGIFAAGDNAFFPYHALGKQMRVEHWDNAMNQGKWAGRNMAGEATPYDYMPYFFSDLFEFGYEAVGEVDARLETFADWKKENDTGVIYYLKNGLVRGVMMCNVWDKVPVARELIRSHKKVTRESLTGRI